MEKDLSHANINKIKPHEHLKPVVICALQTGMRKNEILKLTWVARSLNY